LKTQKKENHQKEGRTLLIGRSKAYARKRQITPGEKSGKEITHEKKTEKRGGKEKLSQTTRGKKKKRRMIGMEKK